MIQRRWRVLGLLSVAELLGMSVWLTASAASTDLQAAYGLDAAGTAWLTSIVQLGFVAGTAVAAVLNLADVIPARRYFAASAVLAAVSNAGLLLGGSFAAALVYRFLTGFFLAGVYPPAMKMAATWFRSGRGVAIGTIVGALTLGKALPFLLKSLEGAGLLAVVGAASLAALVAAGLVGLFYRDGPHAFERRPFSWGLVGTVVRHRETRLATAGYLGHMWELYAMWTAVGLFFSEYAQGMAMASPDRWGGRMAFFVIAAGAVGSVAAGQWADRWGRERVASWAMAVSGLCALTIGWLLAAPPWVVVSIGLVWGFAVVADSAQFSAAVTEVAPPHAAGTALTLQTSAGFLLTMVTVQGTPRLAASLGWGPAFAALAIGPALGILAMARLRSVRARR